MNGPWFPRLDATAERWCGGITALWVDGVVVGQGRQPVWWNDAVVCAGPERGVLCWRQTATGWEAEVLAADAPVNRFSANQDGQWAYLTKAAADQPGHVVTWDGREFVDYEDVAVAPNGDLAMVDSRGVLTAWRASEVRGMIGRGVEAGSLRWTDAGLTWTSREFGPPQPWWFNGGGSRTVAVQPREYAICAVRRRDDVWILTSSETELLFRPAFESWGYRLPSL